MKNDHLAAKTVDVHQRSNFRCPTFDCKWNLNLLSCLKMFNNNTKKTWAKILMEKMAVLKMALGFFNLLGGCIYSRVRHFPEISNCVIYADVERNSRLSFRTCADWGTPSHPPSPAHPTPKDSCRILEGFLAMWSIGGGFFMNLDHFEGRRIGGGSWKILDGLNPWRASFIDPYNRASIYFIV